MAITDPHSHRAIDYSRRGNRSPMLLWEPGPSMRYTRLINRIIKVPNKLTEFTVKSVTEGIDAIGEVLIRIEARLHYLYRAWSQIPIL